MTEPKLRLISKHKRESTHAFGDFRIHAERKSSGDGVYSRRRNWTYVSVTHSTSWGTSIDSYSTVAQAVKAIKEGKVRIRRL